MTEIFSSGGGTQSTAIAGLICRGRLPKPDLVVIADTGRERATTWQYLDSVIRPALKAIGLEVHRVGQEWASVGLFSTKELVLMPCFSKPDPERNRQANQFLL